MNSIIHELTQRDLLELLDTVCKRHHVTRSEVCSRARTRMVSLARQELWWLLRNHAEVRFSYVELGQLFRRNHSTVLAGVKAWNAILERRHTVRAATTISDIAEAA